MKTLVLVICASILSIAGFSQVRDPKASSKSAAQYDAACIDENISYSKDVMYFSQLGIDRGSTTETIDLSRDILTDMSEVLYSMEQLVIAGAGSTSNKQPTSGVASEDAIALNQQLSSTHGFDFDTTYLGGLIRLYQDKLNDLASQKENATNPRLTSSVTTTMSILKRHVPRLNSLHKQLIRRDVQERKEETRKRKEKK